MTALIKRSKTLMGRVRAGWRSQPRGSILILVVALLVLMALIATAYISAVRIDRYTIKQTNNVSQVNLLVDSMAEVTANAVMNDMFNGTDFAEVTLDPNEPSVFESWDGPNVQMPSRHIGGSEVGGGSVTYNRNDPILQAHDAWLGARFPRLLEFYTQPLQQPSEQNNPPIWDAISYPPFENYVRRTAPTPQDPGGYLWQFDQPDNGAPFRLTLQKLWFEPTFIPNPDGSGTMVPALRARDSTGQGLVANAVNDELGPPTAGKPSTFWAADADGDGIADSGLFKIKEIYGITYYAAIRIFDNNSAVNVNTAFADADVNYRFRRIQYGVPHFPEGVPKEIDVAPPDYYFPGSVNMMPLLHSQFQDWIGATSTLDGQGNEMDALRNYRASSAFGPSGVDAKEEQQNQFQLLWQSAIWDDSPKIPNTLDSRGPKDHFEYRFAGMNEAMFMQLGRRLGNPGWNFDRVPGKAGLKTYKGFGIEDQRALMYKFGLINPQVSRSAFEDLLFNATPTNTTNNWDSVYSSVWNYDSKTRVPNAQAGVKNAKQYPQKLGATIDPWFKWNFYFEDEEFYTTKTYMPRRTMFVMSNPVSNVTPRREMWNLWDSDRGIIGGGTNWQVVGPAVMDRNTILTSFTDANKSKSFLYYNDKDLVVDPQPFVWPEQMPYWSEQQGYDRYVAPKASANTANFGELWRAFWMVMAEGDGTKTPFDAAEYSTANATRNQTQNGVNPAQGLWGVFPAQPFAPNTTAPLPGIGLMFNDPYIGQKFWGEGPDPALAATTRFPTLTSGDSKPPAFFAEGDTYASKHELEPNYYPHLDTEPDLYPPRVNPEGWHPSRMFRSAIRAVPYELTGVVPAGSPVSPSNAAGATIDNPPFDGETPRMPSFQMLLLRAALAAVNTEDLRDSEFDHTKYDKKTGAPIVDQNGLLDQGDQDNPTTASPALPAPTPNAGKPRPLWGHGTGDVTARRIVLMLHARNTLATGIAGPPADPIQNLPIPQAANVVVYGYERQPFITEIYASTDRSQNKNGYVAVELFNPYDEDIELTNWKLVAVDRRRTPDFVQGVNRYGLKLGMLDAPPSGGGPALTSPQLIADFDPERQGPLSSFDSLKVQVWPVPRIQKTTPTTEWIHTPIIVPARGYLLLENYYDSTVNPPLSGETYSPPDGVATERPAQTLLSANLTNANRGTDRSRRYDGTTNNKRHGMGLPQLNVAFVPGLSGLTDQAWLRAAANGDVGNPALRSVFNRELVFLRPRRADGNYSVGFYPPLVSPKGFKTAEPLRYDEEFYPSDLVPVDSFDFTGLQLPADGAAGGNHAPDALYVTAGAIPDNYTTWHYVRQNTDALNTHNPPQFEPGMWKFVYPGRYDAMPATSTYPTDGSRADYPGTGTIYWGAHLRRSRQQGVETAPLGASEWLPAVPVTLGGSQTLYATVGYNINATSQSMSNGNPTASYPTRFPIQLSNFTVNSLIDAWDPVKASNPTAPVNAGDPGYFGRFPFGGFAKQSDLLQIPFIGRYRITWQSSPGTVGNTTGPDREWEVFPEPINNTPGRILAQRSPTDVIELNSITVDSAFAEDTDLDNDPRFELNDVTRFTGNVDRGDPFPTSVGVDQDQWATLSQKWRPDNYWTPSDPADPTPAMPMNSREQVGRFCPLYTLYKPDPINFGDSPTLAVDQGPVTEYLSDTNFWSYLTSFPRIPINRFIMIDDYGSDPSFRPGDPTTTPRLPPTVLPNGADWEPYWRYRFAHRLFEYVTVLSPQDDYLPNYPAHQLWDPSRDYTTGSIVQYTDMLDNVPFTQEGDKQPNLWICRKYQPKYDGSTPADSRNPSHRWFFYGDPKLGSNPKTANWERLLTTQTGNTGSSGLARQPVLNGPGKAGRSDTPEGMAQEYHQSNQGLININTANWKVLATLPLAVNPKTGVVDGEVVPQYSVVPTPNGFTYRDLNDELAKAIVYYRDVDGQPDANPGNPPPSGGQAIRVPHGPFKSLFELNKVVDLRPRSKFGYGSVGNPFFGRMFADGLGTLDMRYRDRATYVLVANEAQAVFDPDTGVVEYDPDGGVGELSTDTMEGVILAAGPPVRVQTFVPHGLKEGEDILVSSRPPVSSDGLYWGTTNVRVVDPVTLEYNAQGTAPAGLITIRKRYDGVRGDFEEQFLALSRISNLITARSDSYTAYILIQGYRDAGTAKPKLEVQKRVAYIIDRSKVPYKPIEKILVPND